MNTISSKGKILLKELVPKMNTISSKGIILLKQLEGTRLKPYQDSGGVWTIGTGHLIKSNENNLYNSNGITDQEADKLLINDLATAVQVVNNSIKIQLTQPQIDSLIILAFNIGATAFSNSELVKMINRREPKTSIFSRWVNHYILANGQPSAGLVTRRNKEASLYFSDTGQDPAATTTAGFAFNKLTQSIYFYPALIALIYALYKLMRK